MFRVRHVRHSTLLQSPGCPVLDPAAVSSDAQSVSGKLDIQLQVPSRVVASGHLAPQQQPAGLSDHAEEHILTRVSTLKVLVSMTKRSLVKTE